MLTQLMATIASRYLCYTYTLQLIPIIIQSLLNNVIPKLMTAHLEANLYNLIVMLNLYSTYNIIYLLTKGPMR